GRFHWPKDGGDAQSLAVTARLEQGRFHWPKDGGDAQSLAVTARQLRWLIEGLN
ncbi:MAG: IS66 family insertion sequence element accessory protein TnpB, partial [Burkholderiaceae bacterium]|nr:IS66 family insertion sequence element accessory protein TnpB [Burkholderiaceae bacterium]